MNTVYPKVKLKPFYFNVHLLLYFIGKHIPAYWILLYTCQLFSINRSCFCTNFKLHSTVVYSMCESNKVYAASTEYIQYSVSNENCDVNPIHFLNIIQGVQILVRPMCTSTDDTYGYIAHYRVIYGSIINDRAKVYICIGYHRKWYLHNNKNGHGIYNT